MFVMKKQGLFSLLCSLQAAVFILFGYIPTSSSLTCRCDEVPSSSSHGIGPCFFQDNMCTTHLGCYLRKYLDGAIYRREWGCFISSGDYENICELGRNNYRTSAYKCCRDANNCNANLNIVLPVEEPTQVSTTPAVLATTTMDMMSSASTGSQPPRTTTPSTPPPSTATPSEMVYTEAATTSQTVRRGLICPCTERIDCLVNENTRECEEGELCAIQFDHDGERSRAYCSSELPPGACNGEFNSETRYIACCNQSLCTRDITEPIYTARPVSTTENPLTTDSMDATTTPPADGIDNNPNDPLTVIPIKVLDSSTFSKHGESRDLTLCYKIHGTAGDCLNYVSDTCASVVAHFAQAQSIEPLGILKAVYIRTVDESSCCSNVRVSLDSCSLFLNGVAESSLAYYKSGLSIDVYSDNVRIAVSNCDGRQAVIWVDCQTKSMRVDSGSQLRETAHGLMGQLWNTTVRVVPYNVTEGLYTVTAHKNNKQQSFIGELRSFTYDGEEEHCLYVGDGQGGALIQPNYKGDNNNTLIEGEYWQYKVDTSFDSHFMYSQFDENRCSRCSHAAE